jgi:hypothetical protein
MEGGGPLIKKVKVHTLVFFFPLLNRNRLLLSDKGKSYLIMRGPRFDRHSDTQADTDTDADSPKTGPRNVAFSRDRRI